MLNDVFRGTNVTYTVMDKQIILSTKQVAQQEPQIKVTGVVKDATGEPLIGVNVKVKMLLPVPLRIWMVSSI